MDSSPGRPPAGRRLLILGLDGVPPEFLFDRFLPVMPNVRRLFDQGLRAALRTTDPPISVPAWPVMFTGVDPGTLGLYGFRHRRRGAYHQMYVPTSRDVSVPTFWELASRAGRRVAVIGMPLGFPPPSVNGLYVADFLTPPGSSVTTFPPTLRAEIEREFGPYTFDVVFRSHERDQLAGDLLAMTRQHFAVAASLYARERWDVFALHEIGTDRLHHAYWKHFDPRHPEFVPGNPFEKLGEQYYAALDEGIGRLLRLADDQTDVLIVSDHGSMAMRGCFCINDWLVEKGYLVLKRPPPRPGVALDQLDIDWRRTTAWGAGGYYARIFFNVRGREPEGSVPLSDAPSVRARLAAELSTIRAPDGAPIPVRVLDPREVYAGVRGDAPDLMVYFDGLRVRAAGTLGYPSRFLTENDTGPDDAVHSFEGVFLYHRPGVTQAQELPQLYIRDVTPTLLKLLGLPIPSHVQGRAIESVVTPPASRPPTVAATATA